MQNFINQFFLPFRVLLDIVSLLLFIYTKTLPSCQGHNQLLWQMSLCRLSIVATELINMGIIIADRVVVESLRMNTRAEVRGQRH